MSPLGAELRMGHQQARASLGQVDSLQPRDPGLCLMGRRTEGGTPHRGVHTGGEGAEVETCPRLNNCLPAGQQLEAPSRRKAGLRGLSFSPPSPGQDSDLKSAFSLPPGLSLPSDREGRQVIPWLPPRVL